MPFDEHAERIDALMKSAEAFPAPERARRAANLQNYAEVYRRSIDDPDGFWGEIAEELEWFARWKRVREVKLPHHRWFVGAKLNVTVNALDRHARGPRRNKVAFLWVGETGEERVFTYGRLLREVSKIGNGLRSLGVKKGDRVLLYMPLTPEGMMTMLACARIGAVHSVVYAGMGAGAIRSRLEDSRAKVVVTADVGRRRGKDVELKPIVDEALRGADFVEHVVVHRRRDPKVALKAKEVDFEELAAAQTIDCEPERMDAEDPLFILYTSGTTGKPKGVLHTQAGFMVGTYYLSRMYYDIHDEDVYWSTSDIGWIVGHSYIVYGPLFAGATILVREGAPDYPDPGVIWRTVERHGVSLIFTAPTTLRMFMKFGAEALA
ncbi:MAG: AMP-binding protein, partial [Myxococcales bacterium]|nr:AMP-binding protein [Myxococcales bacterium]